MQPPDLATLIACAWRYKWLAVAGGCVFAVLGAAAGYVGIRTEFRASALVRLASPSGVVERRSETSTAQREFRSTQQELVQMPHVLQRALESPQIKELRILGADPDSIDEVRDWLEVELPRSSEIMRITIQHDRADVAFLLANAITDAYLQEVSRDIEESVAKRLTVLDQLHAETEDRLASSWAELRALAKQLGSGDPSALSLQAQAEIENYRDYARRLRELRSQKREAERLVRAIKETPDMLSKEIPENASMHDVRYAMFTAMLNKEQALAKWGPNHPDVIAAEQQENLLREYYQKTTTEESETPKTRQETMLAEPLATLARLGNEEQSLEAMMAEIDDRVQLLGGDTVAKLEILRNDIGRMERLSDRLWETRENLQVERHADQRVQFVAHASLPSTRDTAKRNKVMMVLAAGGFGFAVFLTAVGEFLTGRLHSAREATQRTGLEMLASLPRLPEKVEKTTSEKRDFGRKPLATQLDMLAARLTHHPQAESPRTILVTSARWLRERERVAVHVAAALARTGQRTVLVNFDFRGPQAAIEFPNANASLPGRSQRALPEAPEPAADAVWNAEEADGENDAARDLSNTTPADNALHIEPGPRGNGPPPHQFPAEMPLVGTGVANLDFLQPHRTSTEPLPVIAHPQLPELVKALRQLYAYVVIDVPGVVEYPDAVHLVRLADISLLSLQRNTSVAWSVVKAQETLTQHGRPVMGTMIE